MKQYRGTVLGLLVVHAHWLSRRQWAFGVMIPLRLWCFWRGRMVGFMIGSGVHRGLYVWRRWYFEVPFRALPADKLRGYPVGPKGGAR